MSIDVIGNKLLYWWNINFSVGKGVKAIQEQQWLFHPSPTSSVVTGFVWWLEKETTSNLYPYFYLWKFGLVVIVQFFLKKNWMIYKLQGLLIKLNWLSWVMILSFLVINITHEFGLQ